MYRWDGPQDYEPRASGRRTIHHRHLSTQLGLNFGDPSIDHEAMSARERMLARRKAELRHACDLTEFVDSALKSDGSPRRLTTKEAGVQRRKFSEGRAHHTVLAGAAATVAEAAPERYTKRILPGPKEGLNDEYQTKDETEGLYMGPLSRKIVHRPYTGCLSTYRVLDTSSEPLPSQRGMRCLAPPDTIDMHSLVERDPANVTGGVTAADSPAVTPRRVQGLMGPFGDRGKRPAHTYTHYAASNSHMRTGTFWWAAE